MKNDIKKAGNNPQNCAKGKCASEAKEHQGVRGVEKNAHESTKHQWQQQKPEHKK
jgi:hypothetical protein